MNATQYASRKAAGKCLGTEACKSKPMKGKNYCKHHFTLNAARQKRYNSKVYANKKGAGICVRSGCQEPAGETVHCERHAIESEVRRDEWLSKPGNRAKALQRKRDWNRMRLLSGKCRQCSADSFKYGLCEKHWRAALKRLGEYRRSNGQPVTTARCGFCREPGHRYESCEAKLRVDLVEYAGARLEWV